MLFNSITNGGVHHMIMRLVPTFVFVLFGSLAASAAEPILFSMPSGTLNGWPAGKALVIQNVSVSPPTATGSVLFVKGVTTGSVDVTFFQQPYTATSNLYRANYPVIIGDGYIVVYLGSPGSRITIIGLLADVSELYVSSTHQIESIQSVGTRSSLTLGMPQPRPYHIVVESTEDLNGMWTREMDAVITRDSDPLKILAELPTDTALKAMRTKARPRTTAE